MKEDNDHRIDQYFRDALEDLNIIPPAEVWNNIAPNLPQKKSSRKMIVWVAVAASVAVLAAFSGWDYLQKTLFKNGIAPAEKVAVYTENDRNIQVQPDLDSSGNPVGSTDIRDSSVPGNRQSGVQIAQDIPDGPAQLAESHKYETETPVISENSEDKNMASVNTDPSPAVSSTTEDQKYNPEPVLAAIELNSLPVPQAFHGITPASSGPADSLPVYDNVFALEEENAGKRKDRWSVGGQMAPLYSYRNITEVNAPGISKSSINQVEKAVVTYASGIMVDFEASPRLSFQTGIYYMKMGQEIDNISNLARPVSKMDKNLAYAADLSVAVNKKQTVANSTGTIVAPAPDLYYKGSLNVEMQAYGPGNLPLRPANLESRKNIEQSFEFIEVPLLARYKIINRKVNLHLLGGVSTHVLVDNKAVLKDENTTVEGKTTGVETMNYSSSVGFGVGYTLRKNLSLNVEPTFKYYLNSFNSGDAIRLHPYAFGLYSGILLKF